MKAILVKALRFGCTIHGHVYGFSTAEEVPLANDPIYAAKVIRRYRCIHCGNEAEDEALILHDEFVQEGETDGK